MIFLNIYMGIAIGIPIFPEVIVVGDGGNDHSDCHSDSYGIGDGHGDGDDGDGDGNGNDGINNIVSHHYHRIYEVRQVRLK